MNLLRSIILSCVFIIPSYCGQAAPFHLRLLHFNDIYQLKEQHHSPGFAKLKRFINEEKEKAKHVIVTFGGDLVPAAVGRIPVDLPIMFKFLNELPIDYAVFGNHEFDSGALYLREQLRASKTHWLAGNIIDRKTKTPLVPSIAIQKMGDKKIGILALVTEDTTVISSPGNSVQFLNYLKTAKQQINTLKKEHVDFIIALTHLSIKEDKNLAKYFPEIDVILGGHDHEPYTYQIGKTLLHKSGVNGEYLGILDFYIDEVNGEKDIQIEWQMRSPKQAKSDIKIQAELNALEARYLKQYNRVIAKIEQDFTSSNGHMRNYESKFGNLLADAMRDHFSADMALINSGAFRADRNYYKGTEITMTEILTELPFKNRVVKVNMSGKKIIEFIEESLKKGNGTFPNLSGMHIVYNHQTQALLHVYIKGKPIDPNKTYSLATVDYLVRGGDGITIFHNVVNEKDLPGNKIIAEVMIHYLEKIGTIKNMPYGRIAFHKHE